MEIISNNIDSYRLKTTLITPLFYFLLIYSIMSPSFLLSSLDLSQLFIKPISVFASAVSLYRETATGKAATNKVFPGFHKSL